MSRIAYSVKNAKVALLFNVLLLVLNFFSRRVFIGHLGEEIVGLSQTVISYIGFLNLADMGISVAIVNALYLPLFRKDRAEVGEIVSLFGFLFKWVGIFILAVGLILVALIPWIFARDIAAGLDARLIYAAFLTFLFTTLLTYWMNYKQHLLVANQKGYVITKVFQTSNILKTLTQMGLLLWAGAGYVSWLGIEVVFGVVFSLWLNAQVKKEYPWLETSIRHGKAMMRKYTAVFKNMKRAFAHKIANLVLYQSDVIVLSIFISLPVVTFFTNYTMISDRIARILAGALNNSYAGVGNLVAEGDKRKIKLIFWEFNALYYWLGAVVAFGFYMLINPFIRLWLPDSAHMILSDGVVVMISVTLFITFVRQTAQYFLNAYGLFRDVWAAWTELGLNVVLSVLLCWQFGVIGVVIGTVASTGLSVFIWKPYFLYRNGFEEGAGEYYRNASKYLLLLGAMAYGMYRLAGLGWLPEITSWQTWLIHAAAVTGIFALLSGAAMYLVAPGMRALVKLGLQIIRK